MRISSSLKILSSVLILLTLALACNRPPDLPDTPSVSFQDIKFEILNAGDPLFEENVLSLSFNVSDGNGDLGLDGGEGSDNLGPYRSYSLVRVGEDFVEFGDRPNIDPPFNCIDYVIEDRENADLNEDNDLLDTLLVDFNQGQYNIEVDFFVKENGIFREVEMRAQPEFSANQQTLCGISFDGRFPCLSNQDNPCNFVSTNGKPIEGVVTYEMNSGLFLPIFRTDTIKLEFFVRDRALNESNRAETPEFTLQSIQIEEED